MLLAELTLAIWAKSSYSKVYFFSLAECYHHSPLHLSRITLAWMCIDVLSFSHDVWARIAIFQLYRVHSN